MTQDDELAVAGLDSPVGRLSVAVSRLGLAEVSWGSPRGLAARSGVPEVTDPDRTGPVISQLGEYFRGTRRWFDLALDWRHTTRIQHAVLRTLYEQVGYGRAITYGQLAELSGTGVPARAIGVIMGRNPLPIVVPCHRVLAHDGLGGYSGGSGSDGLEVKRWLLTMEGVLPPTLDWNAEQLTAEPN
ncbi:MAG: methylated-DNA--[protein]-cysteine S-methyltransferase [Haloechinothrix sp.]